MLAIIFAIIIALFLFYLNKDVRNNKNSQKLLIKISCILFVTTAIVFFLLLKIDFLKTSIFESNYPLYNIIVLVLLSMSISIIIDGILAPIIQKLHEKSIIKKYEKNFNTEKFKYFRDILKTKSPAILSFCYNKQINIEDIAISILLNLKLQKAIKIEENKIIITNNLYKFTNHENYMINNITKLNNKNFNKNFRKELFNDLKELKYIKSVDNKKANVIYFMEFFMAWMIIYSLVTIPIIFNYSSIALLSILAYFLTFAGIPLYKTAYKKINPIYRTKRALELSGKLSGLKNYINDFSNIKENGVENINLYDEYVIYAIIFNLKGKLNDECKQIYINIKDSLDNKI